mmetsp:Transcript_34854/g.76039  ORF Transcript_34854/g.76039 Transcript_34854/m.76039 type:complete len:96 (-) Transcript_34854:17-304(-)
MAMGAGKKCKIAMPALNGHSRFRTAPIALPPSRLKCASLAALRQHSKRHITGNLKFLKQFANMQNCALHKALHLVLACTSRKTEETSDGDFLTEQ